VASAAAIVQSTGTRLVTRFNTPRADDCRIIKIFLGTPGERTTYDGLT
jgi:hypothetical protein